MKVHNYKDYTACSRFSNVASLNAHQTHNLNTVEQVLYISSSQNSNTLLSLNT